MSMMLPIRADQLGPLISALQRVEKDPPYLSAVANAKKQVDQLKGVWKGSASHAFFSAVGPVLSQDDAVAEFLGRFIGALANLGTSLEHAQGLVDYANKVASENHIQLDADGNLSGSWWDGEAEIQLLEGKRTRVEGAVNPAVDAINNASASFVGQATGFELIVMELAVHISEITVPLAIDAGTISTNPFALLSVAGDLRALGAQEAERLTTLSRQNLVELCRPSMRFPGAGKVLQIIDNSMVDLEQALRTLEGGFQNLSDDLLKAAEKYLGADKLHNYENLIAAGVLTVGAGFAVSLAPLTSASNSWAPPDDFMTWCNGNGYAASGEYGQCVAWAQYERDKLGLPWGHANGKDMYDSGGAVVCGPDQVSAGSLVSIKSGGGGYGHVMVVESVSKGPPLTFTCSELNVDGGGASTYGKSGDFRTNTVVTVNPDGSYTIKRLPPGSSWTESLPPGDLGFCTGLDG